jgi:hypothetical protein
MRFCLSFLCDFLPGFPSRFLSERGLSSVILYVLVCYCVCAKSCGGLTEYVGILLVVLQ